ALLPRAAAFGGELVVAGDGKSDYQIVVPDKVGSPAARHLEAAAVFLQRCLSDAAGARLPVAQESSADPQKPSIFIGAVAVAARAGRVLFLRDGRIDRELELGPPDGQGLEERTGRVSRTMRELGI
ncbi:MAG TPA: hypothetical protein P5313_03870, partial [Spirochaetia bacterium]|nr:hypothetical protein [Spirochaetia bacterium]